MVVVPTLERVVAVIEQQAMNLDLQRMAIAKQDIQSPAMTGHHYQREDTANGESFCSDVVKRKETITWFTRTRCVVTPIRERSMLHFGTGTPFCILHSALKSHALVTAN